MSRTLSTVLAFRTPSIPILQLHGETDPFFFGSAQWSTMDMAELFARIDFRICPSANSRSWAVFWRDMPLKTNIGKSKLHVFFWLGSTGNWGNKLYQYLSLASDVKLRYWLIDTDSLNKKTIFGQNVKIWGGQQYVKWNLNALSWLEDRDGGSNKPL